jgi:hypothetical protein
MYAEFSGLVFSETGYMDSALFCSILEQAKEFLDGQVNREHKLYSLGKSFLEINKNKETHLALVKKILGDDWKSLRFRNLVRLGADIENSGLGTLSRPTLIGSLLYQKEKILGDKNGLPNSSDR